MARMSRQRLADGRYWYVGTGTVFPWDRQDQDVPAEVIVPIDRLEGMTGAEIGHAVRLLIPAARLVRAIHEADWLLRSGANGCPREVLDKLEPLLKEFAGQHELIDAALRQIAARRELETIREQRRQHTRKERSRAAAQYEVLFVTVGRRDGFKCARCGAVEQLVLDHVTPVSLGGITSAENPQLLCSACNREKGATIVDYR